MLRGNCSCGIQLYVHYLTYISPSDNLA